MIKTFKLFINKRKYYKVLIFSKEEDMIQYARNESCRMSFRALLMTEIKGNKRGEVLFCKKYLTPDVIVHELAHIALDVYDSKKKLSKRIVHREATNESFAQMMESLAKQFWNKYK